MPFKQGVHPCLVLDWSQAETLHRDLRSTGYGPNPWGVPRHGEVQAWVKPIGRGRQVHVQEELRGTELRVFAHTEPEMVRFLKHATSAWFDEASYSGGARVLLNDLRFCGWRV
jgi:hypothetical protein